MSSLSKYSDKPSRRKAFKSLVESQIQEVMKSRVPVKGHGITKEDAKRASGLRIEKKSVLEKRAMPSISKGFKFAPTASGVAKTKPKLPQAEKKFTVPKMFNQSVSNPNKSLIKSSAAKKVGKDMARDALLKAKQFGVNTAKGVASGAGQAVKDVVGHAGGKGIRDFSRNSLKMKGVNIKAFNSLSDAEKLKAVSKNPSQTAELKKLMQKRDASRVVAGVAAGGAVAGGVKLNKKVDEIKQRRAQERLIRQYQQYYGNQR